MIYGSSYELRQPILLMFFSSLHRRGSSSYRSSYFVSFFYLSCFSILLSRSLTISFFSYKQKFISPLKNLNSLMSNSLLFLRYFIASLWINSISWNLYDFLPYPEAKWQLINVIQVESICKKSITAPLWPELPLNPVLMSSHSKCSIFSDIFFVQNTNDAIPTRSWLV